MTARHDRLYPNHNDVAPYRVQVAETWTECGMENLGAELAVIA